MLAAKLAATGSRIGSRVSLMTWRSTLGVLRRRNLILNPNRLVGVLIVIAMGASIAAAFWIDAIVGLGAVAAWAMYLARLMRG